MRLLGRSLQVGIENALRDSQHDDIKETLLKLEKIDPSLHILIFDTHGSLRAASEDSPPVEPPSAFGSSIAVRFEPANEPERLILAVRLTDDTGTPFGSLVAVRPLIDVKRDLEATRRSIILSVAAFVALTWVIGALLGRVFITTPLTRLAAAMDRVRTGDLTSTLSAHQRDEAGALAAQFNAMITDLREARMHLEQESDARGRMQRGLEEANKLITIGQLSAGLAHEIGSPLQILHGRASALLARAHDPDQTRKNAEILIAQAERITGIVEQLLKFARRPAAQIVSLDLVATVKTVLDLIEIEARRRHIRLTFSCTPDHLELQGDPNQIQQVVLNLLTNAFAATARGGTVSVRVERGVMSEADTEPGEPSARLIVEDDGCGIPSDIQKLLFEPFFTTRHHTGGTGLGLAVVKAIVTEHRGAISVRSQPGQGATFTIDLPCAEPRGA
jgi:signal transduction histidine kinase